MKESNGLSGEQVYHPIRGADASALNRNPEACLLPLSIIEDLDVLHDLLFCLPIFLTDEACLLKSCVSINVSIINLLPR